MNEAEALREEFEELRGELHKLKARVRELEETVPIFLSERLEQLEGGGK